MTDTKDKHLVQTNLTNNIFLSMQENSFSNSASQVKKPKALNALVFISSEDGIKIYIKACNKVLTILTGLQKLTNDFQIAKRNTTSSGTENKKNLLLNIVTEVEKIRPIIDEFKRGFSIIPHIDAKDFILMLYKRFHFISEKIDHIVVFNQKVNVDEAIMMTERVIKTFERMLDYAKPVENADVTQSPKNVRYEI